MSSAGTKDNKLASYITSKNQCFPFIVGENLKKPKQNENYKTEKNAMR